MEERLEELFVVENNDQLASLDKDEVIKRVRLLEAGNRLYQEAISHLNARIKELRTKYGEEGQERLFLKEQYLIIRNEVFGASSERRKKDTEVQQSKQKKTPKSKVQLPSLRYPKLDLKVSRLDYESPPSCRACHGEMGKMEQVESCEYIEVITRQFYIKRQEREKYRCPKCHGDIQTTPAPPRLVEGGHFSNDFAIEVSVGKYVDHLPIERQKEQMNRQGLVGVKGNSLIEQTHHLADLLRPVYRELGREVKASKVLQADESPWKMLEGHPRKNWYLWGFLNNHSIFFQAKDSRSQEVANKILSESSAKYLMVDGYTAYHRPSKKSGISICHCWAHARRKFIQAEPSYPEAQEMINLIGELYAVEREAQDKEELFRLRQTKSKEIIDKIRQWIYESHSLPKSSIGKANNYLMKYWEGLTRFLEDADIPLDNNLAERSLRGPVLGRKNAYGSHSQKGAETSAILYSICESCKLNGLDPYKYLQYAVKTKLEGSKPPTPYQYRLQQTQ